MQKNTKKAIVILLCLTFLSSAVGLSLAQSTENNNIAALEETIQSTIVIFYRCGADGTITPVKVNLNLRDEEDIGEILADKCSELLESDIEMQTYLKSTADENNTKSNLTLNLGLLYIKSHGKGFHFKTKTDIKIITRFKLFKLMIPRIRICGETKYIFCKYSEDEKANTTITPVLKTMIWGNATKTITGNHSVLVHKFVGYTTWCGRFSNSPLDIFPRAFSGYARLVVCNKLN